MGGLSRAHVLSFEGPDGYSKVGGLATRVDGLTQILADAGIETHLWFVGAADRPGTESLADVQLHRWCQWLSAHHSVDVYDGESAKVEDYGRSLPPVLVEQVRAAVEQGQTSVILAEEWQTVPAVLHLDRLLRREGLRQSASILWNANNTFGFEGIDWAALQRAASITTVSRYMKHLMQKHGIDPLVIPNGINAGSFLPVSGAHVREFQKRLKGRAVLAKMARWDPAKAWDLTLQVIERLRERGHHPLLVARGGNEAYGREVLAHAERLGLRMRQCQIAPGPKGLNDALNDLEEVDILLITSFVDPAARQLLFRCSQAVLANSTHEPFGLVGLEAMAARGVALTGFSGEDYASSGENALVLQTKDPMECVHLIERLRNSPDEDRRIRREGFRTAQAYLWEKVLGRELLPRIELAKTSQVVIEMPKERLRSS